MAHEFIGQLESVLLILTMLTYTSVASFGAAAPGFRDFFFLSKFFENIICALEPGLHLTLCS